MALERQNITIPLSGGINTKVDSKLVQSGSLELENASFKSPGQVQKRDGLGTIGDTLVNIRALTSFQGELNALTTDSFYSYSQASDKFINKGVITPAMTSASSVIRNGYQQSNPDCAYTLGFIVYAWEDTRGGIRCSVIDNVTNQAVIPDFELSASGSAPRCAANNNSLFVYYIVSNNLKVRKIDAVNPIAFEAEKAVVSDVGQYVIKRKAETNVIAIQANSTKFVKVGYLYRDGTIATALEGYPDLITTAETAYALALEVRYTGGANDGILVFWADAAAAATLNYRFYNLNLTNSPSNLPITTPLTAAPTGIVAGLQSETSCLVVFDDGSDLYSVHVDNAGTIGTLTKILIGHRVQSQIFNTNFIAISNNISVVPEQGSYYVIKIDANNVYYPVSRVSYGIGGTLVTWKVSSVININGVYSFCAPIFTQFDGVTLTRNGVQRYNIDPTNYQYSSAQLGNGLYIAAGLLYFYDGNSIVEDGFFEYPVISYTSETTGSIADGAYQWIAVYEWNDNQGQLHRSATSLPASHTLSGGPKGVVLTINTLKITNKTGVTISIYRTRDAGNLFFKVSSVSSPVLNSKTVASVTFTDTIADATLITGEQLYTTGGVLDNDPPPTASIVYTYNNRLVLGGTEDDNEIWYSKQFVQNEGIGFSQFIKTRIDQGKRGITGIAQLDEKIIFFKDNSLYVQLANGPTDTGFNNDIGIPQSVATDVGCTSNKSIVITPKGLMFKSRKGYYLLDRSLTVSYVGAEVEAFNTLIPSGATLMDDLNQIRFTHEDGSCLVYDYFVEQWATYTNYNCIASRRWQNSYVIARANGVIDKENPGHYLDNSSHVSMKVVTPWMKVAGLQGFQRVYQGIILGEFKSNHKLRVKIGYNFENFYRDDFNISTTTALPSSSFGVDSVFGASTPFGSTAESVYQFKINNTIQKCQAIRFEISDLDATLIDGQSMNLTAITLDCGMKRGTFKLPVSKNM